MRTLEILIPTYSRPKAAANAIEACLKINDDRLSVLCHSNGYEQSLEKYRAMDPRIRYDNFIKNEGVHRNIEWLLGNAKAKFCMLLSDEDELDPVGILDFLNFIESDNDMDVVIHSTWDLASDNWFYDFSKLHLQRVKLNNYLSKGMISPWYMSGITCRTSILQDGEGVKKILNPVIGNAYPHLDLILNILNEGGSLIYYAKKCILKGKDVTFGGDGYSHRADDNSRNGGNLDLNPKVYGPLARVEQFFYRERIISQLNAPYLFLLQARVSNFYAFIADIDRCGDHVVISEQEKMSEIRSGLRVNLSVGDAFSITSQGFRFYALGGAVRKRLVKVFFDFLSFVIYRSKKMADFIYSYRLN